MHCWGQAHMVSNGTSSRRLSTRLTTRHSHTRMQPRLPHFSTPAASIGLTFAPASPARTSSTPLPAPAPLHCRGDRHGMAWHRPPFRTTLLRRLRRSVPTCVPWPQPFVTLSAPISPLPLPLALERVSLIAQGYGLRIARLCGPVSSHKGAAANGI